MALGEFAVAAGHLQSGIAAEQVRMFTEGNLYTRYEKRQTACELLADGLDELDDLISQYIQEVPLAAYDGGCADAERFLQWLTRQLELTDEQQDFVACQRGRHAVEFVAVKQRLAHVRFQELLSMNDRLLEELGSNGKLTVYLNPVHAWSAFQTRALLDEEASVPATVMFFPVGSDIRTAIIESDAEELIGLLEPAGRMRYKELKKLLPAEEREGLPQLIRDLAEMGMVALG
jgi:hypothetical protein